MDPEPEPLNAFRTIHTGRLLMRPVGFADLPDLIALKADPLPHAIMLGGVRTPEQTITELADDIRFWGAHGVGTWTVRAADGGAFLGYAGLHHRPDGRGIALRFAFALAAHGRGYASEAAAAALRFGHERAHLRRVIALARETNIASREVLGGIGMVACETYKRGGHNMIVYESIGTEREEGFFFEKKNQKTFIR